MMGWLFRKLGMFPERGVEVSLDEDDPYVWFDPEIGRQGAMTVDQARSLDRYLRDFLWRHDEAAHRERLDRGMARVRAGDE